MTVLTPAVRAFTALAMGVCLSGSAVAQGKVEYKVLSTSKTSTMQKEMQEGAEAGFRFADVMGGSTALGGAEVVVIMTKEGTPGAYEYRLLATSKTSTMQKELQEAGDGGFEYKGQTVFKSAFGGKEVVAILERAKDVKVTGHYEYRLLATSKTSTMQKELTEAGDQGFEFVGVTVGKTVMGGDEVVLNPPAEGKVTRRPALAVLAAAAAVTLAGAQAGPDGYLSWSDKQAEAVGLQAYQKGRVGGMFDMRVLKTDRAYNYKLAATWLTPDAIRATARLVQLRGRLSEADTRTLVKEAEAVRDTVIMVEIDPREGSGVIPNDWQAFLQPKGRPDVAVRGTVKPELRDVKALAGVVRRNYDYDRFWVAFPLTRSDGAPLFSASDAAAELVVRIYDKEGHVDWPIPSAIRQSR